MTAGTRLVALATSVALAGCRSLESPTEPTRLQLVIHAVLDAASFEQLILVERARTGSLNGQLPVTGATVTVRSPDGEVFIAAEQRQSNLPQAGTGRYSLFFFPISALVPGGAYQLRVRTPAGEEATGMTVVPNARPTSTDSIRFLAEAFIRERDTLRLSWARVPGARSYEVRVRSNFGTYVVFADTSIAIPGTARSFDDDDIFPDESNVGVVVSAVDQSYYDFYHTTSDPFAGAPPTHLDGAVGVFGSVVPLVAFRMTVR